METKNIKPENRSADSKGRLNLGKKYAEQDFIIKENSDGTILLEPAVTLTIPAREAWLWKNRHAMNLVATGLKEAREGQLLDDPTAQEDDEDWLKELDNED